jgi:hypothetical protein
MDTPTTFLSICCGREGMTRVRRLVACFCQYYFYLQEHPVWWAFAGLSDKDIIRL